MRGARTRRRAAAVALAAAAVPLLGACGIRDTDVIEAGGPASVQAFFNSDSEMLLFFRTPDGGVSPVIRTSGSEDGFGDRHVHRTENQDPSGRVPTEMVVAVLLAGPRPEDRAAGLTTALPARRPGTTVKITPSGDDTVTAGLPFPLKNLDPLAVRQLTCTIAYSRDADGRTVVHLRGQDGTSSTATCALSPDNPGTTPSPTHVQR